MHSVFDGFRDELEKLAVAPIHSGVLRAAIHSPQSHIRPKEGYRVPSQDTKADQTALSQKEVNYEGAN